MNEFLEHPIVRRVIIFITPVITYVALLIIFHDATVIESFEAIYVGAKYIIPYSIFIYITVWTVEKLIFHAFRYFLRKKLTARTRFGVQLFLSTLLSVKLWLLLFAAFASV